MKNNFVPALPQKPAPPAKREVIMSIDAPLTATQHVEFKTSATDRSKGFLIAYIPLFAAFGLGVVCIVVVGWNVPIWSLATFAIFWLSFVASWIVGYGATLTISAEGVSFFEAVQKWRLLNKEHDRLWKEWNQ